MSRLTRKKRGMSVFAKTFLTTLAIALIPVVILGLRTAVIAKEVTTAQIDRLLAQEATLVATRVAGWLETNIRFLQQNALSPEIQSCDPQRQTPVLHAIANTYKWPFLVATIGADGKNIARSDISPPMEYNDREYFRQAMAGNDIGYQVLIAKTTGKPALAMAVPYHVKGGGTAVLMTSSHLTEVTDAVSATRLGNTGFSFLLDAKGRLIAHRDPELQGKLLDLSKHPAYVATRSAETAKVTYDENGKRLVAHALVTRLGWVVVVQQDVKEAFASVDVTTRNTIISSVAVAILALLASFILARALTAPILRLTAAADTISRGETSLTVAEIDRTDELGGLARAIDRMRVSIDVAMKRLRRKSEVPGQHSATRPRDLTP
jgi:methyl-accepting chemotaxis protein